MLKELVVKGRFSESALRKLEIFVSDLANFIIFFDVSKPMLPLKECSSCLIIRPDPVAISK